MQYRKDIDGLRAISVLAVIVYHGGFEVLDVNVFGGGFLGVDVFFVISGFLISSIIFQEVESGSFSLFSFYKRRIKRLLPAYFLVVAVSSIAAWLLLLPEALNNYAKSMMYSLLFSSNIFFWLEDSYVAVESIYKPLLHTWSLSVEEQFYLFFPIISLSLYLYSVRFLSVVIWVLWGASLAASWYFSRVDSDAVFFLLPFRLWELLSGVLLALYVRKSGGPVLGVKSAVLFYVGVLLILASFQLFSDVSPIPVGFNVVAVLGAVLVIYYGGSPRYTFLQWRPVVFIGLISYSLYLWHFPVLSIARIYHYQLTQAQTLFYLALVFPLSVFSFYAVERTFRKLGLSKLPTGFAIIRMSFLILLAVSGAILISGGVPSRLAGAKSLFSDLNADRLVSDHEGACLNRAFDKRCEFDLHSKHVVILVGDSHAGAISKAVYDIAMRKGYGFVQLTLNSCLNLVGVKSAPDYRHALSTRCIARGGDVSRFMAALDEDKKYTVIYFSRMSPVINKAEIQPESNAASIDSIFHNTFNSWISSHVKLALVYPVPELERSLPDQVYEELRKVSVLARENVFKSTNITIDYAQHLDVTRQSRRILDGFDGKGSVVRIYPEEVFCDSKTMKCQTHNESSLYYYDDNHLSVHGAALLVEHIEDKLLGSE